MENKKVTALLAPSALCLSGFLSVLCFPSFNHGQWAWGAFVPCLLAAPTLRWKSALGWSGVAGVLAGIGIFYWVYPTCRWGGTSPAVGVLAVLGLSLHWAFFWALFGGSLRLFYRRPLWEYPFWAAASWTVLEWLRGTLFSGFPWLTLACSQWQAPKHLPLAEIGGGAAVSFLILLFNGSIAVALAGMGGRPRRWAPVLPSAGVLIALTGWSVYLWRRPLPPAGDPIAVAVIQGNIDQYKKWDSAYEKEIVQTYEALTREAGARHPALIVWPETAAPGWVPNDPHTTEWVQSLARGTGAPLLAGAVTRQGNRDYNAAFLLSPAGDVLGRYRKIHLVPFGEYVPLRGILAPFVNVLNDVGTFEPGPEPALLPLGGTPLGVTICFEGIFPRLVGRFTREGARVLLNLTNDGWYRRTAAPEQHFAPSVLRAVENRRWVVRAANTGYSGFISPRGEVVSRTPLMEPAVLYGHPVPMTSLTYYARHGDGWVALLAVGLLMGVGANLFRLKKSAG